MLYTLTVDGVTAEWWTVISDSRSLVAMVARTDGKAQVSLLTEAMVTDEGPYKTNHRGHQY